MLAAERNRVFESWIDAHKAILFKVARVYGATHSDREDLFQEIALQLWHSVEAYRGDCVATTWIYRVALNTALAWRRKERKHGQGRQDIEAATGLLIAPLGRDPRLDWILGTGMAVWAGFWIAITITNGWRHLRHRRRREPRFVCAGGRRDVGGPRAGARADFRQH